jgi:hypothetical protein
MPNRYQTAARREVYETIARYEGNYCLACLCEGAGRRGPPSISLEIDHAGPEVHLLCKKHNLDFRRLSLKQHTLLMAEYSAKSVCVRARENLPVSKIRTEIDYTKGSIEMQVNTQAEEHWLEFMHGWIDSNGNIPKGEAINSGSIAAGDISPSTTTRYLAKHCASFGRFQEVRENGIKVIIYRNGHKE